MRRVLYIAHYFPPIGGAGVQRTVKFVKHLAGFGWSPLVLTGRTLPETRWTPDDRSLQDELPDGLVVGRADAPPATKAPANRRRRYEAFVEEGERLLAGAGGVDAILVTMSPFEDARIARELSQRHGLPWLADLRDPWALDEFQEWPSRWHRAWARHEMERSLAGASRIIMNTPEAARRLRETFPTLANRAGTFITNGYDEEDFRGDVPAVPPGAPFTLVHSGYFHTDTGLRQRKHRWRNRLLGRLEPGVETLSRSHFYLVQAVNRWLEREPAARENFRMEFVGVPSEADRQVVREARLENLVTFTGYLPHDECVRRTRRADLLFLPMHHLPAGRRSGIVPGKVYEYMASGRPILAAVPDGDARDYLAAAGTAHLVAPTDVDALSRVLATVFARWREGNTPGAGWRPEAVLPFERRELTRQLAEVLDGMVAEWHRSGGATR